MIQFILNFVSKMIDNRIEYYEEATNIVLMKIGRVIGNTDFIGNLKYRILKHLYLSLSPSKADSKPLMTNNTVCPGAPRAPKRAKIARTARRELNFDGH